MAQFCTECGAAVETGKKFCTGCGAKIEPAAPVQPEQPAIQTAAPAPQNQFDGQPVRTQAAQATLPRQDTWTAPAPAVPVAQPETKLAGMLWYLGHLIVLNIPIVGLVMSIIWGVKPIATTRRNLARAMIFINAVWLIVFIVFAISAYSVLSQLSEVVDFSIKLFGITIIK